MKKLVAVLAVLAFVGFGVAYAAPTNTNVGGNQNVSDNANTSSNVDNVSNTNHNNSDANSHSSSDSNSKASASQSQNASAKQAQGQGQGQLQAQNASNNGVNPSNTTTTENSTTTKVNSYSPAMTPAAEGTDSVNASSPFFNAGISSTKKYVILRQEYELVKEMVADGYLTPAEAKMESSVILDTFRAESRRKKVFGFVPFTRNACDNALLATIPVVCD